MSSGINPRIRRISASRSFACRPLQSALDRPPQPDPEQRGDHCGVNANGGKVVLSGLVPPVVQDRGDGDQVDQAVQAQPVNAEAAHHGARRGRGERQQQCEGGKAGGDERAPDDIGPHQPEIELLVDPEPDRKMQQRVEEAVEAEHSPQLEPLRLAGQAPQRRNRQRQTEEDERPSAGRAGDEFKRIGT